MRIIEHPDREALTLAVAHDIVTCLGMALRVQDRATLSLPGGSTPVPVFKALSAAPLDWDRVTIIPGDERWVPSDHPRSNARLIRRHLLDEGVPATLVELYDPALDPEAGAAAASARVAGVLPLSVVLLGMGEDMHTASLFPGAQGLAAALHSGDPAFAALPDYFRSRFEPALTMLLDASAQEGETRADIAPYEAMKLRLLNASHSVMAYLGYLAGHETIADTIAAAEGRRIHFAHIQFYSYAKDAEGGMTSGAEQIAASLAASPNVTCDVGQVMFGPTVTISLDLMKQYQLGA